jgi:heme A synthase
MGMQRFERFSWVVLAYNLAVIAWGAFVRATGSGAGCGAHWPMCNGEVVPRAASVETMIELTHRATSGIALVLVVVQLVWALRLFPKGHRTRGLAIATMVFMLLEALVGAGLVLLELVADNQSAARAGWIAVHLVNTFLLVASLSLTPWSVRHEERPPAGRGGLSAALAAGAVLLLLTGVAGAITALGDTLFPAESLASGMAADLSPTAHFLVRLRVIHPLIAALGGVFLLVLTGFLASTRSDDTHGKTTRTLSIVVAALVVTQLLAGLANLYLLAPVWMQLVHLLLADLLWIAFVLLADVASHTAPSASRRLGTAELPR